MVIVFSRFGSAIEAKLIKSMLVCNKDFDALLSDSDKLSII